MLDYDFQNSIGYWLCMASHAYERAMNEELTAHGITFRQCQVLAWLALEGEQSQTELATRMNIEPPTLVRVLDRMERDGLVSRSGCRRRSPPQGHQAAAEGQTDLENDRGLGRGGAAAGARRPFETRGHHAQEASWKVARELARRRRIRTPKRSTNEASWMTCPDGMLI